MISESFKKYFTFWFIHKLNRSYISLQRIGLNNTRELLITVIITIITVIIKNITKITLSPGDRRNISMRLSGW